MKLEDKVSLAEDLVSAACAAPGLPWVILGVDPGLSGAMAFLCPSLDLSIVFDMPTVKVAKGNSKRQEYDYAGILQVMRPAVMAKRDKKIRLGACVEKTAPVVLGQRDSRRGKKFNISTVAVHSMGWSSGMWALYLQAVCTWEMPVPMVWKSHFKLSGPNRGKADSLRLATRLFPEAAERYLTAKSHHDRAEALLLAEYFRVTRSV